MGTLLLVMLKNALYLTINQIEPTGPGIFNFPIKNLGKTSSEFDYEEFVEYEKTLENERYVNL